MKYVVIVESPAKEKTIEKYLGKDYKVVSSKGHIRDLATTGKYGFGIDVENDFEPNYKVATGKTPVVKQLKKDIEKAEKIYLATDPDREGEAISWHLKDCLGIKDENYERIVFNEITKDVILREIKNGRKIDDDLVKSQETRRMLDRIIGFRLSKLMQKKTSGKSAGRVQSVALKLIVEKEEEINAFNIEEYFEIEAQFDEFNSKLYAYNNENIEITTKLEADNILNSLDKKFNIDKVDVKQTKKNSKYPFITSTLQQVAASKLGWPSKKTMSVAQKMYEGIALKDETVGLITYMRTDSIRLSDEFIKTTYKFIDENYGKNYIGFVKTSKKKEKIQDAHEAIRPTSVNRTPNSIKEFLSNDEYKLYSLIYARAVASLMKEALLDSTTIILENNNYQFKTTGSVLVFDGYLKVYGMYEDSEDKILPNLKDSNINSIESNQIESTSHFTKPPARYSEAKLIRELEEQGIGRPSTYSKIIDTLKLRSYVEIIDKKFHPTEVGIEIIEKLEEGFSDIINVKYTAKMEEDLDEIANGKYIWNEILKEFYNKFEPLVDNALENMEKVEDEKTGEICPECSNDLVYKQGKYGKFTACSNFPKCKYIKNENKVIVNCPNCDGQIIERFTKSKKIFYGCNNFPKCKTAFWDMPTDEKCPKCQSLMSISKDKSLKCSNCEPSKKTYTKKTIGKKTSTSKKTTKKTSTTSKTTKK